MGGVITLLTDFGLLDHYVGVMKGVILSICPEAKLVDITHEVPPQNIAQGAYLLGVSYKYFPRGSVHVGIVDPGVGTNRRAICVVADDQFFIGPDNGLFTLVYDLACEFVVYELKNSAYFLSQISSTFHGRDIFAPVAAYLACGLEPSRLGPVVSDEVRLSWPKPVLQGKRLIGGVIHVDRFGNLITNISRDLLRDKTVKKIIFNGLEIPFKRAYAAAKPKSPLALIGSDGLLEIAISMGSAAQTLGKEGRVIVEID